MRLSKCPICGAELRISTTSAAEITLELYGSGLKQLSNRPVGPIADRTVWCAKGHSHKEISAATFRFSEKLRIKREAALKYITQHSTLIDDERELSVAQLVVLCKQVRLLVQAGHACEESETR